MKKLKKFNHLKPTPKPDFTISNQENKAPTGKPKMSYTKALMRNLTPLQNNEGSLNIQPRPITLKEQLKVQHPARQTFKREKLPKREQNSRPPSRYASQTSQSDRLQAQIESLRRQDTNTTNKKQQLNNQNYTKLHTNSH